MTTSTFFRYSINSLRKMVRLKSVSQQLSKTENQTVTDLFELAADPQFKIKKDKEFNQLMEVSESDPKVRDLITRYGADRRIMRKMYDQLVLHGAGRFARGYWVAAASLAFPETLEALFRHFNGEIFLLRGHSEHNSGLKVAYRMFTYFADQENSAIEDI